jgi:membrane-associated phospholipid phosphatase
MLPWIQTRPPRLVETTVPTATTMTIRRINLGVLGCASIGANTVPSGHAAGSMATALAVATTMPAAGAIFLVLACSITVATVIGRYHYVVDSVLGVLVALIAWWLVR